MQWQTAGSMDAGISTMPRYQDETLCMETGSPVMAVS